MREIFHTCTTGRLVALALAAGLLLGGSWAAARGDGERTALAGLAKVVDGDTILINAPGFAWKALTRPKLDKPAHAGCWAIGLAGLRRPMLWPAWSRASMWHASRAASTNTAGR